VRWQETALIWFYWFGGVLPTAMLEALFDVLRLYTDFTDAHFAGLGPPAMAHAGMVQYWPQLGHLLAAMPIILRLLFKQSWQIPARAIGEVWATHVLPLPRPDPARVAVYEAPARMEQFRHLVPDALEHEPYTTAILTWACKKLVYALATERAPDRIIASANHRDARAGMTRFLVDPQLTEARLMRLLRLVVAAPRLTLPLPEESGAWLMTALLARPDALAVVERTLTLQAPQRPEFVLLDPRFCAPVSVMAADLGRARAQLAMPGHGAQRTLKKRAQWLKAVRRFNTLAERLAHWIHPGTQARFDAWVMGNTTLTMLEIRYTITYGFNICRDEVTDNDPIDADPGYDEIQPNVAHTVAAMGTMLDTLLVRHYAPGNPDVRPALWTWAWARYANSATAQDEGTRWIWVTRVLAVLPALPNVPALTPAVLAQWLWAVPGNGALTSVITYWNNWRRMFQRWIPLVTPALGWSDRHVLEFERALFSIPANAATIPEHVTLTPRRVMLMQLLAWWSADFPLPGLAPIEAQAALTRFRERVIAAQPLIRPAGDPSHTTDYVVELMTVAYHAWYTSTEVGDDEDPDAPVLEVYMDVDLLAIAIASPVARAGLMAWSLAALNGLLPVSPVAILTELALRADLFDVACMPLGSWADMLGAAFQWTDEDKLAFTRGVKVLPAVPVV
jgi:hypothetical protein